MTQFNMLNEPSGPDPKRLLLAVVLTSAVLMLYSYFFPSSIPAPEPEPAKPVASAPGVPVKTEELPKNPSSSAHALATPSDLPAQNLPFVMIDNGANQKRTS